MNGQTKTTKSPNALDLRSVEFSRILLIKPSALGDVVHTIPVLVKLRARYPRARIDWLITPENAEIVRCHPALSNVVLFARRDFSKRGRRWRAFLSFFDLLKQIRRAKYDLVIDMHGQVRSAFFALITGARVRIGFDRPIKRTLTVSAEHDLKNVPTHGWRGAREGSWIAYTHRIPIPTLDVHAIDRYLWVGELLGFDDTPPDLTIYLSPETIRNVDRLLSEKGVSASQPLIVLVPGTIWETKHWTIEGFAGVARQFLHDGYAVALAGTKRDEQRSRQIAAAAPGACDLSGKTTPADLAALIRRAEVTVTNDSGSMHVAASLGKPMVSIFGPTNPVHIGPYERPDSVVRVDLPCSPCNYRRLSQCPYDHACMKQVTSAMVVERVQKILLTAKSRPDVVAAVAAATAK
ncbi:MAG: lipopolysaccharide heptosyltransferase II [Verrucomicrobia bacterium]|nr:MAG: lipopolysaccharide heptosyltransferase II [Verrucomicrobiota bacterium]